MRTEVVSRSFGENLRRIESGDGENFRWWNLRRNEFLLHSPRQVGAGASLGERRRNNGNDNGNDSGNGNSNGDVVELINRIEKEN